MGVQALLVASSYRTEASCLERGESGGNLDLREENLKHPQELGTDGNNSPGVMVSRKENEIPRAQTS